MNRNTNQTHTRVGRARPVTALLLVWLLTVTTLLKACGSAAEESFVPAVFEWSGGTGKIEMTCERVRMDGAQAYATIIIDSSHYSWLKVDGKEYDASHVGETSQFEIPVILNEKMEISGLTMAMSQPHEITYTIYVGTEDNAEDDSEAGGTGAAAGGIAGAGDEAKAGASDTAEAGGTGKSTDNTADAGGEAKVGASDTAEAGSTATSDRFGETDGAAGADDQAEASTQPPEIAGLTFDRAMQPDYAVCFDVYYDENGYKLLDVRGDARYLLIPEGAELPEGVTAVSGGGGQDGDAPAFGRLASGETIVLLHQPLEHVYLAATAVMALVDAIGAIDAVTLTGTDADGWYLDAPKRALASGQMRYAGKYSQPDYEMLVQDGCDLAIESTMILHAPEVQEKIEELGIPVLVDHSSYEEHPLGRAEWVRFYGALFDCEDAAEQHFAAQKEVLAKLADFENTGKTVAFFYISQDGTAIVRSAEDYIPRMIELAGGRYMFDDLEAAGGSSAAVSLSLEEFYAAAAEADYLIYNASIDAPLTGMEDLLAKSELFSEFRAVQAGQVWTTDKNLYQATDSIGLFIRDLHEMLTDGDESRMEFLKKVQ